MSRTTLVRQFLMLGCAAIAGAPALASTSDSDLEGLILARETVGPQPATAGVVAIDVDTAAYDRLQTRGRIVIRDFPLPGRQAVELRLSSFSVVAPDARFVVVDEQGERDVAPPPMRFFRGTVAGDPNSLAVLSLFEGRIAGFVRGWGEEFGFGPDEYDLARAGSKNIRVWNRRMLNAGSRSCDLEGSLAAPASRRPGGVSSATPRGIDSGTQLRAQVAVDGTVEWFSKHGSLAAAQAYTLNLMAQVSAIYDSELLVQIEVPYLRIFTAEPDPYTNGSTDTSLLLNELQAEWNANQTGVFRSVAHLFSTFPSGGSGLAYVDVLCDNVADPGASFDYGVSLVSGNGASFEKELVAHELGHNFSSPHTNCYVPEIDQCYLETGCYPGPEIQTVSTIMSRCDDDIPEFHPRVESEKIRPAAEAAFPTCVDTAGLPGDIREVAGAGLDLSRPASCPVETLETGDGSVDTLFGGTGTTQLAWIKRFTPGCYPYRLTDVRMITGHSSVAVGRPIRVVVYSDPGGSGDPADATLVHNEDVTVQVVNYGVFNSYTLSTPVTLASGDFYLGFYDLVPDATTNFIAVADTGLIGDSHRAFNSTSPADYGAYGSGTWLIEGDGGPVPAGSVLLDWGAPCNDATVPGQDYGVYQGVIGTFGATSSLTCSTGRDRTYLAEAPPDGSFFLVVPQTTAAEGSYGRTSAGVERSPAAVACKTQDTAVCP